MSVIVKNMEMPERCGRCFFVRWSNLHQTAWCTLAQEACFEDFSRDYKNRRADFCPLVEIPTQHGRLIDTDEPMTKISTMMQEPDYQHEGEDWMVGLIMARDALDDAPTVIEAEGSES